MAGEYPWRDKELLKEKYHAEGKSMKTIANEWDTTPGTINRWTDRHDIETRDPADRSFHHINSKEHTDKDWLKRQYHEEEKSLSEIAEVTDVNRDTIYYWMNKHDIELRDRKTESRKRSRLQRATFSHSGQTYELAESYNRFRDKPDNVLIHRLCAVAWFGLEEVKDKVVHHDVPIPWLNTEQNLEVMTQSEHSKLHAERRDNC